MPLAHGMVVRSERRSLPKSIALLTYRRGHLKVSSTTSRKIKSTFVRIRFSSSDLTLYLCNSRQPRWLYQGRQERSLRCPPLPVADSTRWLCKHSICRLDTLFRDTVPKFSPRSSGWCDYLVCDPIACPPELCASEHWRNSMRSSESLTKTDNWLDLGADLDPESTTDAWL